MDHDQDGGTLEWSKSSLEMHLNDQYGQYLFSLFVNSSYVFIVILLVISFITYEMILNISFLIFDNLLTLRLRLRLRLS